MITCNIVPFRMPQGVKILTTDWEVARDKDMTDIIRFSYNDAENTHAIIFDYEPEQGRTYFSRAKCTLTSGPLDWGPVKEHKYDEGNIDISMTTPSPINVPKLTTAFWQEEHPHTNFTITSSKYEVIGNSRHTTSIWTVTELLTGKVILSKSSELELYTFYMNVKLDYNTQYVISVIYVGDNGDSSPRASLLISTSGALISNDFQDIVSSEDDFVLTKTDLVGPSVTHEWFLYNDETELITLPEEQMSNIPTFTVVADRLEKGKTYLLQGRNVDPQNPDNKYKYHAFTTRGELNYGLPGAFPYKLGQGGDADLITTVDTDKE